MKKLFLSSMLGASALALAACGDNDAASDEPVAVDTATADATVAGTTSAAADWPAGTRIVEEGGVTYRVDPGGTRVRIDDEGIDLRGAASGPDIPGVDVDVGTNNKGNLDVDVSTDGTDASNDRENDR